MDAAASGLPDWRDAAAYAVLLGVDRSALAWEWLRRNSDYRRAANLPERSRSIAGGIVLDEQPDAFAWGLHAFEDPSLGAPAARPVWRANVYSQVLLAVAEPAVDPGDGFELARLKGLATLVRGAGGAEHLLLSDGSRALRLDLLQGSLLRGPARLRYLLAGLEKLEPAILVLRRLIALWKNRRFVHSLRTRERTRPRDVLTLRTYDALRAGVTEREIAAELLSAQAREERWRIDAPELRSRAQRLVRAARSIAEKGGRSLLEQRK